MSEHDTTGLYYGSLHQSNLKGYKVIISPSMGVPLQTVFKGVVYLAFTPFATMV